MNELIASITDKEVDMKVIDEENIDMDVAQEKESSEQKKNKTSLDNQGFTQD